MMQMKIAGLTISISPAQAKGERFTQEDGCAIGKIVLPNGQGKIGYFAIIDGHAGASLTFFLQKYFKEALREHFEIAGKPLKDLEDGEIENLLTTFPVRLQQMWRQNKEEWSKIYVLGELENFIGKAFVEVIDQWKKTFTFTDAPIPCPITATVEELEKAEAEEDQLDDEIEKFLNNEKMIFQILGQITHELDRRKKDIAQVNPIAPAFFELVLEVSNEINLKFLTSTHTIEEKNSWNTYFEKLKKKLEKEKTRWTYDPGAVLSSALIMDRGYGPELWTTNVGDSAVLLLQDGKAIKLTEDASLSVDRFREGVKRRGGVVTDEGSRDLRVKGPFSSPNFARSLGDLTVPGLSSRGDVQKILIHPPSTLIVGSDGLFETRSCFQIGRKCRKLLKRQMKQQEQQEEQMHIAAKLDQYAYSWGSPDNISCIVAQILET
jgi:serine/threonine protein phosphatase PrpC